MHLPGGQSILDMCGLQHNRPEEESELELFKRELYFPLLDKMTSELDNRFSSKACEIMSLAAAFHQINLNTTSVEKMEHIAKIYQLDGNRIGNKHILFSMSRTCAIWKENYEKHLAQPENKNGTSWVCLLSLLNVFSKDDLHN